MSLNRWVFKWRLEVRMFPHSGMSAGRELQVDGAVAAERDKNYSVMVAATPNKPPKFYSTRHFRLSGRLAVKVWCCGTERWDIT